MKSRQSFVFLGLGILSGLLSGLLWTDIPVTYLAMGLFGLVLAAVLLRDPRVGRKFLLAKSAALFVLSVVAYLIAQSVFIFTSHTFNVENAVSWYVGVVTGFLAAGLIGSSVMVLGLHALVRRISKYQAIWTIIWGGLFGVVGYCLGNILSGEFSFRLPFGSPSSNPNLTMFLPTLFVVWQGGMAYVFGRILDRATAGGVYSHYLHT